MKTFWQRAKIFSPILVRLLARHPHGAPLTYQEISKSTGGALTPFQVVQISRETNWGSVDVLTMQKFLTGCGVDFCNRKNMKRIDAYLRTRPNFKYLRTSPEWKTLYEPMIRKWRKECGGHQI